MLNIYKCEIDGKINLCSHCIDSVFKKVETINKEGLSTFFESLNYVWNKLSYYLKCKKKIKSKNLRVAMTSKGKLMLLSKCEVYDSETSRFIKKQGTSGLLNNSGLKTNLSEIPLLGWYFVLKV